MVEYWSMQYDGLPRQTIFEDSSIYNIAIVFAALGVPISSIGGKAFTTTFFGLGDANCRCYSLHLNLQKKDRKGYFGNFINHHRLIVPMQEPPFPDHQNAMTYLRICILPL